MFWYIKHKTLNTDIWNYLNNKRYFKYQTKTGSRWQQVTVDSVEAVVIFGEKIALFV